MRLFLPENVSLVFFLFHVKKERKWVLLFSLLEVGRDPLLFFHFSAGSFTLSVLKTLALGHHCTDLSDCPTPPGRRALREAVKSSFQYTVLSLHSFLFFVCNNFCWIQLVRTLMVNSCASLQKATAFPYFWGSLHC